jgi:hypothetical protein
MNGPNEDNSCQAINESSLPVPRLSVPHLIECVCHD